MPKKKRSKAFLKNFFLKDKKQKLMLVEMMM